MARVLAFSVYLPGHVYPMIPTLRELQARGSEVVLALCGTRAGITEIAGVPVREIDFDPDRLEQDGYSERGEPLAVALERLLVEERPDLLLIDPANWGGVIVAEASGLPWATVAHNPLHIRALGVDVRGPGLPPARGRLGRMWHRIVEKGLRVADQRHLPTINAVRIARGLAPASHPWDLLHTPPLVLAYTAEPFEYPRSDWPPSLRFVGPAQWEPSGEAPEWVGDLDDRPVVLVATSSLHEARDVVEAPLLVSAALEGLADQPLQVVVTMPIGALPERVPTNARVERYAPHGFLLSRAACVVCHGGAGITQKALAAGVPVVAVPSWYDRFEIARRVEVARAGVRLPFRQLTPARLRAAVDQAIRCRAGAERVAAAFREAGGAFAAADAVEDLHLRWQREQHVEGMAAVQAR